MQLVAINGIPVGEVGQVRPRLSMIFLPTTETGRIQVPCFTSKEKIQSTAPLRRQFAVDDRSCR
jgi:hypothetical protein